VFTGLIQDVGAVESVEPIRDGIRLRIATRLAKAIGTGDSVAVDGICLTATHVDRRGFECEAMYQTLKASGVGKLGNADRVNLELAAKASDRLGGHIVQGHIDGVGDVISAKEEGIARRVRVALGPELIRYVVERGSIALQGVSLTVAGVDAQWIEVALIPETMSRTTLGEAEPGSKLNVECDVVAKYVERLVQPFVGEEQA
jgi:riboflavin synthase